MQLSLLSGRSHPALARAVGRQLGTDPADGRLETFPDKEIFFRTAETLLGHDVFLIQPTSPPAERFLLELLLMADGCRRAGAAHITAVIPYFGYARQDRRLEPGQAVGAKVVADLISTCFDRVITVDLHNPAVEGFFSIPVDHLSSDEALAGCLKKFLTAEHVLVAPDLGAVKRVHRFADLLDAPVAYVHKERFSGDRVRVRHVSGSVQERLPVLIDDMISTGGTILSALEALTARGCRTPATVVAAHPVLVGDAVEKLAGGPIERVITTNSVPAPEKRPDSFLFVDIADRLAEAIRSIHAAS